ncbi:MAG: hypothetical protein NC099_05045 [Corallococcus sp.]|nr:hypothetical protein [Corallococcus sp.]
MTDIILFVACALLGYAVGKYFEKRVKEKGDFYSDLKRYVALFRENIVGRQVELNKFNEEFCSACSDGFAAYIACGKIKCRLTTAQRNNLSAFFDNLDCVSSQQLGNHLDYSFKILSDDCNAVLSNEVAKSNVYGKLGLLFGAMVGIVLI